MQTIRSSEGIRDMLFQEIDDLRSGKSNAARLRAIANGCSVIVSTVALYIAYHKHLAGSSVPQIGAVKLGSERKR